MDGAGTGRRMHAIWLGGQRKRECVGSLIGICFALSTSGLGEEWVCSYMPTIYLTWFADGVELLESGTLRVKFGAAR